MSRRGSIPFIILVCYDNDRALLAGEHGVPDMSGLRINVTWAALS